MNHSEEESLKLVDDFNTELTNALDSLGARSPTGFSTRTDFGPLSIYSALLTDLLFSAAQDASMAQNFSSDPQLRWHFD
jgi:hypothetical protein